MKNKRIMMSGYFGFDNAGDEAICAAMIHALRQLDSSLEFVVLSANPEKTAKTLGVSAISRTDVKKIWKELKSTDLFISGGGSLLQDKTGNLTIPYYLGVVHLARWAHVPVAVYAQGIGPVRRLLFQKWIKSLFKKLDYISVRDTDSKKLLTTCNLTSSTIDEVVDPVFLLPSKGDGEGKRLLAKEGIELTRPPIILSVRQWKDGENDIIVFAQTCDLLIEQGEDVLFMPFHYPDDLTASKAVISKMKHPAKVLNEHYSPEQLLDIVSNGKIMIAMRLHALIFAAARETPCIGISYDPKIDAFLDLLGEHPVGHSGHLTVGSLLDRVKELEEKHAEIKGLLAEKKIHLQELAWRPALRVVELLR